MNAIKDITTVTNMYIFFYGYNIPGSMKLTNIDSLSPVLLSKPNLTRLYLHFGYNLIADVGPIENLVKLRTELRFIFYVNK